MGNGIHNGIGHRVHRRPDRRSHAGLVVELGVPVNAAHRHAAPAGRGAARPPGVAAHQPRLWPWPQQQDQHRRRAQQARHLAHRPACWRWPRCASMAALVGLHMHIGSGVDYSHLEQVCRAMVDLVKTQAGPTCRPSRPAAACRSPTARARPHRHAHYFSLWDAARQHGQPPGPPGAPGDRAWPLIWWPNRACC
jgi:hypothetical protein